MAERAIITGISGFVGGFLAESLLQSGGAVLGFSPDGKWLPSSPHAIQDRVLLSTWNFSESGDDVVTGNDVVIREAIERFEPEVVYHLAALSVPSDCGAKEPTDAAVRINVEGTRRVVEAILAVAPKSRLVFTSSSYVYAPVDPAKPHIDESGSIGPVRGYGKTKLAAEQVILDAVEQRGLDAVIARAFQHAGPRQTGRMMLPEWMKQIVNSSGKPIEIQTRDAQIDLLDVRDVVRAYQALAELGQSGAIYNVGSGMIRSTGDLIDRLLEIADEKREIIETRPGTKQDPVADVIRLKEDTDWEPLISIDTTLSDTLTWWRETYNL